MGEQKVHLFTDEQEQQNFIKGLLNDVRAMEYMIEHNWFETNISRIGAEQEMVLIDQESFKPVNLAVEMLEELSEYPWVESELAQFNLEIGLTPQKFEGKCFELLEKEISDRPFNNKGLITSEKCQLSSNRYITHPTKV